MVASLEETRWDALVGSRKLWRVGGGITQGDARGCSGGLSWVGGGITHGTWELLSRFDCVYSDYITQGCPGGALAVAMSLRARSFFFPTHRQIAKSNQFHFRYFKRANPKSNPSRDEPCQMTDHDMARTPLPLRDIMPIPGTAKLPKRPAPVPMHARNQPRR